MGMDVWGIMHAFEVALRLADLERVKISPRYLCIGTGISCLECFVDKD